MIDSACPIWRSGCGFCWAPSSAWGCTDQELCAKCQAKPRVDEKLTIVKPSEMPNGSILLGPSPGMHTDRTCRFCGQNNVHLAHWRKKDRMCMKRACWAKFIAEMKLAV